MPLASLLIVLLAPTDPGGTQGPRLVAAEVSIERREDHARVAAIYRIEPGQESTIFHAIRFRGQQLTLEGGGGSDGRVSTEAGLHRIELSPAAPATIHLRYRLRGATTRIPIFVPDAPASPGVTRLRIILRGRGGPAIPVFPRFGLDAQGDRVAEPTHLPALVLLRPSDRLDADRLAEWLVVLLLLMGSLAWLARRRGQAAAPH